MGNSNETLNFYKYLDRTGFNNKPPTMSHPGRSFLMLQKSHFQALQGTTLRKTPNWEIATACLPEQSWLGDHTRMSSLHF